MTKNTGRTEHQAIILSGNNHQELSQQLQHMINGLNGTQNAVMINLGGN